MLMLPLLEYNKHIAKIPNCKMRSSSLRLPMPMPMLLLLWLLLGGCQALDNAASSSNGAAAAMSGAAAAGTAAGGGGGGGGGSGGAAAGAALAPGALNANLTDLGSPGVYNSTKWFNANYMLRAQHRRSSTLPQTPKI
ncbi:hypothetical protein KR093_010629 [Drosophila rubida]|uniref:Uncharacterized protein n=1 Tax=Drosophila rubida TaxID=30044 RepID=A0AAD4K7B2_9MUSC|nr:hypothetical protein KR093_010629 [Drosophila rubida]